MHVERVAGIDWRDPSGRRATADQTLSSIGSTRAYLATVEADILRRTYRAPRRVSKTLASYGASWIKARPNLKNSTRHQYGIDFRRHIEPYLGHILLDRIDPASVREWHSTLTASLKTTLGDSSREGHSTSGRRDGTATVARSYRLLRAILQTSVDDELLLSNPCRIAGASESRSGERPTLRVSDLAALAKAVPSHYRALVILAGFSGLRAGEIAPLCPRDLRLSGAAPTVSVNRRFYRVAGVLTVDTPKSQAGGRTVVLPAFVAAELRRHLARASTRGRPRRPCVCHRWWLECPGHVLSDSAARDGPRVRVCRRFEACICFAYKRQDDGWHT